MQDSAMPGTGPKRQLIINAADIRVRIALLKTPTADAIWAALPFATTLRAWGSEVFFDAPVRVEREPNAKAVIDPGAIAYWPDDAAIAIGLGPTPLSRHGEIRHRAACNIWATAVDDVSQLKSVPPGTKVMIARASAIQK